MVEGIYKLTNDRTGEVYVGQAKDLDSRLNRHLRELAQGKHHNKRMQNDHDRGDTFSFEILEKLPDATSATLKNKESHYINKYNCFNEGYNRTPGGAMDQFKGRYKYGGGRLPSEKYKPTKKYLSKVLGNCPECNGNLIRKNGKFGEYIGCDNFPKCTYTCSIYEFENNLTTKSITSNDEIKADSSFKSSNYDSASKSENKVSKPIFQSKVSYKPSKIPKKSNKSKGKPKSKKRTKNKSSRKNDIAIDLKEFKTKKRSYLNKNDCEFLAKEYGINISNSKTVKQSNKILKSKLNKTNLWDLAITTLYNKTVNERLEYNKFKSFESKKRSSMNKTDREFLSKKYGIRLGRVKAKDANRIMRNKLNALGLWDSAIKDLYNYYKNEEYKNELDVTDNGFNYLKKENEIKSDITDEKLNVSIKKKKQITSKEATVKKTPSNTQSNSSGIIVYCNHCGGIVDKQDTHCKYCGKEITDKYTPNVTYKPKQKKTAKTNNNYCSQCGEKIDLKDEYCSNCGEKIDRLPIRNKRIQDENTSSNTISLKNSILKCLNSKIFNGIKGFISILITLDVFIDCQHYYPIIKNLPILFLPIILPAIFLVLPFEKIRNNKKLGLFSLIIVGAIFAFHFIYMTIYPIPNIFVDPFMYSNNYANIYACLKVLFIVFILNIICSLLYYFQSDIENYLKK